MGHSLKTKKNRTICTCPKIAQGVDYVKSSESGHAIKIANSIQLLNIKVTRKSSASYFSGLEVSRTRS